MSAVVTPLPSVEPRRLGLKVMVRALKVEASIGFYDHEHGRLQPLVVDVELDLGAAPVERLADTLDYDGVARIVRELAAGPHIALIETFAERAAVACLADPRVLSVVVRVEKPGAIPDAAAAACEVAYSR
ncbi:MULTISPECIES: dihydroneopterin aldolase [Brevundimonas]|uniref:dihydroneopterin aldolase n=1 Tax=Brevundimonas TaxID=41275 RepID=UPI000EC75E83|nr:MULTISPECIES: dihydroneopterin aldolase [Brevundimonas]MDA0743129.1 dihydroneopterin aldolase [Pseudomonadota bacterium]MBI2250102.1 dihydroneopterin aldolase [Brevundimonas diminuta]MBK1970413.1 dihydroneopterin aldolase [Brevundimonas diminuta]MBK1974342.1 dihydroneopterin aldolase [Brevundimonas diminuta]MDA1321585.1 dihydroneopterin aldolase [Pseudomonadota bacterium]